MKYIFNKYVLVTSLIFVFLFLFNIMSPFTLWEIIKAIVSGLILGVIVGLILFMIMGRNKFSG